MAQFSCLRGLVRQRFLLPALLVTVLGSSFGAEIHLSLAELGQRKGASFESTHSGQIVVVRGVVSAAALHFAEYNLLPIEDGIAGGLLKVSAGDAWLDRFHPGDEVEAAGKVVVQYGVPMVSPDNILQVGHRTPPAPLATSAVSAQNAKYNGRLLTVEGVVAEKPAHNAWGALIFLKTQGDHYQVFVPRGTSTVKADLSGIQKGDTVRVAGIGLQYAPIPPYNAGFEVVAADIHDVVSIERASSFSPPVIAVGITLLLLAGFVLWSRERRLRGQRRRLRKTYQLGEEILSAPSPAAILKRLSESLPSILGVTRVRLYLYNRGSKTLESVAGDGGEGASISLTAPPGGTPAGAVACFHYRTLLVIPDIERSPFPIGGGEASAAPKSLLFAPMMAQTDVAGVLELDQDDRVREFTPDEQALAQHLGNQIGVAIRLLDQRSVQEQLFRTEKMAVIGRLISSVVNELQGPLVSIRDLATRAMEKAYGGPAEREVAAIAREATKASGIVTRLISFASNEQVEARAVDVNQVLRNLIDFREGDWKASGIRLRDLTSREPLMVLGSHGQLEQVFLNLLVHAEQTLLLTEQRTLTIRSSLLARRLLVEISYSVPPELRKPEETAAVLGVTRGVVAGLDGEIRLIEKSPSEPRFEIELPAQVKERPVPQYTAAPTSQPEPGRTLTALVIEPEETAHRQLLALLSARGYRVVPVDNSDTGLDLAQRMRFDAAFCSIHAPGLNWVELSERLQSRVGRFVLLSDGFNADLAADFEGGGRFVLPKPVQETEMDRVLRPHTPPAANVIPFKTGTA